MLGARDVLKTSKPRAASEKSEKDMTEKSCITDLFNYENDRAEYLWANQGALDGFTTPYGQILQAELADNASLRAHLEVPASLLTLCLTTTNRRILADGLNSPLPAACPVTQDHIETARQFVTRLIGQDIESVAVITAPKSVMRDTSMGTVYSCGHDKHLIVIPESHFEPVSILVHHFAVAAQYTAMRKRSGIAAMVSDCIGQSMVGHYAVLKWSIHHSPSTLIAHLRNMAKWEFAAGLSRTASYPMGFIVSDLGVSLLKDYGGEMFKSIVSDLYESMPDGRAMWFGTNSFLGCSLALVFLDQQDGIRNYISIDTGDKTLIAKLEMAGLVMGDGYSDRCNDAIGSMLRHAQPAVEA